MTHICLNCDVTVIWWLGKTWKHATGGPVRSCGKEPMVALREDYERDPMGTLEAAIRRKVAARPPRTIPRKVLA